MLTDTVKKLIDAPNFAHLAVVTDEGPHVSPVWIDRDGDQVLVNTAEGRVKTEALRDDPRVGVSIYDQEDPYSKAVIQGRVVEFRHHGARDHIDELAFKYLGEDTYPGPTDEERVILVIEPEKVTN